MKKLLLFLTLIFNIVISQLVTDSGTYHQYKKIIRNCNLEKLGHLRAREIPIFHPVVASIGIYKCYDNSYVYNPQIGYLFILKAYLNIERSGGITGGFVPYINRLMKSKQIERLKNFDEIKSKLYSNIPVSLQTLLNELENELDFLSNSNMKSLKHLIEQKEISVNNLMNKLLKEFDNNVEKKTLLKNFKDSKLDIFIPEDLNLISNAMGRENDPNEIKYLYGNQELILESNIDNVVKVYLNDLVSTKMIRTINCGKYSFKRFLDLLIERYYPTVFKI